MSKPIDQEREAFEAHAIERGLSVTKAPEAYMFGNGRRVAAGEYILEPTAEAWAGWRARAAAQPAGVAVPNLTDSERQDLIEFYRAVCCDAGHSVEKAGMKRLAEIGAVESVGFGKHRLTEFGSALLAAAPHPVSGEQTVDQHNAAYWQEQYELLRKDYQRSLDERAQDVAGLVEALDHYAGCGKSGNVARVALAAHRAQQGEQP